MILFSNKSGQLGNRLFAFAHLIATAEASKVKLINLSFDEYAQYFQQTNVDLLCRYPPVKSFIKSNKLRSYLFILNKIVLKALRAIKFESSAMHTIIVADLPEYQFNLPNYYDLKSTQFLGEIKKKQFIFLFGRFFRDYDNLKLHQDKIKRYFTPIDEIQSDVNSIYQYLKLSSDTVIGVHIRRGDFAQFVDGKYLYSFEQYAEKMMQIQQSLREKKLTFIICSNEDVDLSYFKSLPVIKGPGHLVKDMYLLAKCDYIMGPPSTYTLWASFYGNKPLYQIKDMNLPVVVDCFVYLEAKVLYNFSFN